MNSETGNKLQKRKANRPCAQHTDIYEEMMYIYIHSSPQQL